MKLTKEQKDDIVKLNKAEKKAAEIIAVLKDKYKVNLKPANVYYVIKQQRGFSKGKKKKGKKGDASETQNDAGKIIKLVERLDRANQAIFNYLRINLIRKLSEKHAVLVKEEIPIPEGDEIMPEERGL